MCTALHHMYRVSSIGLLLAPGVGGTSSGLTEAQRRGIPVLEFWGLSIMATAGMRFNSTASQFSMGIHSTSRNHLNIPK